MCRCACNHGYGRPAPGRSAFSDNPEPAPAPGSRAFHRRRGQSRSPAGPCRDRPRRPPWRQTPGRCSRTRICAQPSRSSGHAETARHTAHRRRRALRPTTVPTSEHSPWASAGPTALECVCPFPLCISAQHLGRPFRPDRQTAFRHSARATSMPCRSCSQQPVRSPGSPSPPRPTARSGRAAAIDAPSSSSAPSPQAQSAPPPSIE